jgi:pilus assembly protein CpaC
MAQIARGFMMNSKNQQMRSTLVHGRWSLWTCSMLCLAVVTVTLPALADEPVVKPTGTRIVQPLVVQASYSETAPVIKQDEVKNKQDKTAGKTIPPVVTPVKTPQTGQGTGTALPEPPKFPNLDNKLPTVPPKTEPQDKSKPQPQDIFAPRARMNAIDAPIGSTPKPDQKTLDKYRSYVESIDDPDNTLELVVGRPRILQLKQAPVKFQAVDPNIADIEVIKESKDKAFFVLGKQPGTTVIALFFSDPTSPDKFKVLNYLVRVVPDPETKSRIERVYKALELEINRAFPDSVVRLCLVGDKLVVSGQAKDASAATKILQVIREQAPQQTPANRLPVDRIDLTVTPDPLNPDQTIAQGLQNFVVSGNANIINLLRVPGEQQVMLRVQVAEVSRKAARSIGLDFNLLKGGTIVRQNTGGLLALGQSGIGAVGGTANVGASIDNGSIILALNALRNMGYARTLAEPTLVTLNGQAATFQAGGEFPVPVVVGNSAGGLQGVNYKPFGVSLNFTPIVTDKDRIRLTINAEVSGINSQAGSNGGGTGSNLYSVPNQIDSRRFTNVVELREGQTLAVAGLISNGVNTTSTRIPLFGDIPFIGRAFGYDTVNSEEQELIFIITPELVHPMECSEVPPLPGYNVFEPGDTEFYLFSRLESRRSEDYRAGARTDIHRMLNYKQGRDTYISGPFGSSSGPAGINPGPNNVVIPTQPLPVLPPPQSTGPNPPR